MKIVRSLCVSALLVISGLGGAGCSPSGNGGGPIESRDWRVRAYVDSTGTMADAFLTVPLSARFENGTVKGGAGCSQFTASYALSGGSLTISDLSVGTEKCDSYATGGRDTYMAALPQAATFKVDGKQLVVFGKEGNEILRLEE